MDSLLSLLTAIVNDDRLRVRSLLKENPPLSTRLVTKETLYQSSIYHWLYVNDTPLHLASAGYCLTIAKTLLAAGADPTAALNRRCATPLHYAADGTPGRPTWNPKLQVKTILCLLNAGANINAQDKNGATPLHRAVRTRSAAAVECLLRSGADPRLPNLPGSTPFHLAVQNTGRGGSGAPAAKAAQRRIIAAFLAAGLSPDLPDASGFSVRQRATQSHLLDFLK